MVRKIAAIMAAVGMLIMPVGVYAENSVPIGVIQTNEETVMELSLNQALEIAIANSPKITAADASIKSAELSLVVTNETQKDFDKVSKYAAVKISDGLEVAYLKHKYYPMAAGVGVELAKKSKEQVINSISYEVTEKYYNVKLAQKLLEIAKEGLSLANDNKDMMENYFEVGLVSQLDVRSAQNAAISAENTVKSYERSLRLAEKSLKVSLQMEGIDNPMALTDEPDIQYELVQPDEMIVNAMNTRYDVTALKKDYELKSELFRITKMYVGDHTALYNSAYSNYLNSEYTYNNTKSMIMIGLEGEYASVLALQDQLDAAESTLHLKEDMYESAKAKYELGLITNLELLSSMAEMNRSKLEAENAKVQYTLAVIKFNYNTNIGI